MQGRAVGEDADDVGAAADLAVESLVGVVGPDLAPHLLGEGGEREDVGAGVVEVLGDGGQLAGEGVDDAVELGVHRLGVGLVVDRVQQRLDPAPGALRGDRPSGSPRSGCGRLPLSTSLGQGRGLAGMAASRAAAGAGGW